MYEIEQIDILRDTLTGLWALIFILRRYAKWLKCSSAQTWQLLSVDWVPAELSIYVWHHWWYLWGPAQWQVAGRGGWIRFVLRMTLWSLADISHHYIFVFVKVYWQIWIKIYWDYYYYYCWVFCVWWSNLSSGCGVARGVCVRRVHTLTCHWVTSRPLSRAGLSWSGLAPCPPHPHTTHNVSWP